MAQGDAMDIHESVHRILEQKESFADLFYVLFLEDFPEVRQHFSNVNFRHQSVLLTMTLLVMERHYTHSYPATEMYLNYLGTKHNLRGIPPQHYPMFRDALLGTLQRFHGQDWDSLLDRQWREAIDSSITSMIKGYQKHYHV
jgi:hemoglobin-like flavoprotein